MSREELLLAFREGKYSAEEVLKLLHSGQKNELSEGQKELWMLQTLYPDMAGFNLPLGFRISEGFQIDQFRSACEFIIGQFPILSTVFAEEDGVPYSYLKEQEDLFFEVENVSHLSREEILELMKAQFKIPFNLHEGPLIRFNLYQVSEQECFVLVTIHHIIFDGTSSVIFSEALLNAYQKLLLNEPLDSLPTKTNFDDFVKWEKEMIADPDSEEHFEYWKDQLKGELPLVAMPSDHHNQGVRSFRGATLETTISGDDFDLLNAFSKEERINKAALFLAAFKAFLYRYSQQEDILIGMPTAGRPESRFEDVLGYFIYMVSLRTRVTGDQTFRGFLKSTQYKMADTVDHANYPTTKVLRDLNISGNQAALRLFRVSFFYQNFIKGVKTLYDRFDPHFKLEILSGLHQEGEQEFVFEVFEEESYLQLNCHYDPDSFEKQSIEGIIKNFLSFIKELVHNPDLTIDEYQLLAASEQQKVLNDWNRTASDLSQDQTVLDLIAENVKSTPDAVALVHQKESVTYRDLEEKSNAVAAYLLKNRQPAEKFIGIGCGKSLDMIIGLIGVLKSGMAYIPIDVDYPDERIEAIVRESGLKTILTGGGQSDRFDVFRNGVQLISLEDSRVYEEQLDTDTKISRDDLAYVLFTSGSTGVPKGVMITHKGLLNLSLSMQKAYRISKDDRVVQFASLSFDMSVEEIFPYLACGARIVIRDKDDIESKRFLELVVENKVTILNLPPAFGQTIDQYTDAEKKEFFNTVRLISFGGDQLESELLDAFRDYKVQIFNAYGPTEYTVNTTLADLTSENVVTIGKPIDNTYTYILDKYLKPVPVLSHGELYISGAGIAKGYLNQEELTSERFIDNPFIPGTKMYRTGDNVRWNANGDIEFLGRLDYQVKIRGFRIELSEVESAIHEFEKVSGVVVIDRKMGAEKQLIAFFTPKLPGKDIEIAQLTNFIKERLPDYMVPAKLVQLDLFPLTGNGKIDRKALAAIEVSFESSEDFVAPQTDTEKIIAEIWQDILQIDQIGIYDNFFELGGHSLLATQVISRTNKALNLELPLRRIFEKPTISELTKIINETKPKDKVMTIKEVLKEAETTRERVALSYTQERLWFLDQLGLGHQYHIPAILEIKGDLNKDLTERAFQYLVERHESFRTVFEEEDGVPYQRILSNQEFKIQFEDISVLSQEQMDKTLRRIVSNFVNNPFDLKTGPLLRLAVIKLGENKHVFAINTHHIISDGWSTNIITKEFSTVYTQLKEGKEPFLDKLEIQYADYTQWQRLTLSGDQLKKDIEHWVEHLKDYEDLSMPTDFSRPVKLSGRGGRELMDLNKATAMRLSEFSRSNGKSSFAILLTAMFALLHYYTRQSSINIGMPMANRNLQELGDVIGFFANTVITRMKFNPQMTFRKLIDEVFTELVRAQEYQQIPFEKIVEAINPSRDQSRTPLFQVMASYMHIPDVDKSSKTGGIDELDIESLDSEYVQVKFDLKFAFTETFDGNVKIMIEYSEDLYKKSSIENMMRQYEMLLSSILAAPDNILGEIKLISETEEIQLVKGNDDNVIPYASDKCVHEVFTEKAIKYPDRIAVKDGDKSLTYAQLNEEAEKFAAYMISKGVGSNDLVAICMDRTYHLMISLMAVMKAGAAYVPIGLENPDERISFMLEDSEAVLILADGMSEERLRNIAEVDQGKIEVVHDQFLDNLAEFAGTPLQVDSKPDDLAYVIYTSGSTGKPKGVLVPHRGLVNYTNVVGNNYFFLSIDINRLHFAFYGNFSFDASGITFLTPLVNGGTCHVFGGDRTQQELVKEIFENDEINAIKVTPSHLKLLIDTNFTPSKTKKMVISGGEALAVKDVETIYARGVDMYLVSQYGPTETTIGCTAHYYKPSNKYNQDVVIGKPLANCKAYVLDEYKNPLPYGIPGELYIGGDGVAKGYLKRPDLTEERFLDNPFDPGTKFYKTGDLVRWLANGDIEFLGRIDQQVKIRGYRVELGEIESAITSHEKVGQASVIYKKQNYDHLLIAYYTASEEIEMSALKEHVAGLLPEYMVPVLFTRIDEIPLTANGKADKKFLESKHVTLVSSAHFEEARNEVEAELVKIWKDLLNVEKVGINDNFFELGGHSLLATRIISRINNKFNVNLPVGTIFSADHIKALALKIDANEETDVPVLTVMDRPENIPLSYTQERLWFLNELGQGDHYLMPHVFEVDGHVRIDLMQQAIDIVVSKHESLRTYFRNENGTPYQEVDANLRIPIQYYRFVDLEPDEKQKKIEETVTRFCKDSFNLAYGPLIRFMLLEKAKNQYIFGFTIHHIISDGWSGNVFRGELSWCYENLLNKTEPNLPALKIQYIDYTLWQRQVLSTEKLTEELNYWKQHLEGYQDLALPTDFPRPLLMKGAGNVIAKTYSREVSQQIAKFSNENSVTVFNSLTAAVYVLLHVYSTQEDITVGMPIANRTNSDLEGIIGFFANTVVSRIQLDREEDFLQLLSKVKAESINSQDHQNVPFEKVVNTVQPERELSKTPIFQVLVNYQVNREKPGKAGSLNLKPFNYGHDSSKFDLHFAFYENPDGIIAVALEYSTELFTEQTIVRMADQLGIILDTMTSNPGQKLSSISLLSQQEEKEVLTLSGTRSDHSHNTIHQLIDAVAKKKADQLAVKIGDQQITYASLIERSDRLAGNLYKKGVRKNDLVAICMDRSVEMVVAMLGVMKAGGGYVPIDHNFPAERKQYILSDSKATQLISKSEFTADFDLKAVDLITLDNLAAFDQLESATYDTHNDDSAISYVIYTSGSTGKPKGVLQTHKTISNLIAWQNEEYAHSVENSRKVSQFASIGFDVSVQEIFFTLISGDTLMMIPEELKLNPAGLINFICSEQMDICYLPTAYLDYFCLEANKSPEAFDFSYLKRIIVAGEALKITDAIRNFFLQNPDVKLENQYGPSETHVVTAYTLSDKPEEWDLLPSIGSPVANTTAYILDDQLKLVPRGAVGELYFGGAGLANSYLSNQELTDAKFITNPYTEERLYKTGDLAKWSLDGNLQFIGRTDHQAKIRGYRIEPGEVEARLTTHEAISQASVIVKNIENNNYLVAFYVADAEVSQDQLRKHLAAELPEYMIPSAFEKIDEIPLTHNGKTDVRKLATLEIDFTKGREYVAPENEIEEKLAQIWGELLKIDKVSTVDNFFEIGGHSLLATQLISRINHEFNVDMHLSTLFKQPTIQGCALELPTMSQNDESNSISNFMDQEDELTF
ncbi:MAG: amino acid adenylation domain-containing protein [Bacteroidota bacterium]